MKRRKQQYGFLFLLFFLVGLGAGLLVSLKNGDEPPAPSAPEKSPALSDPERLTDLAAPALVYVSAQAPGSPASAFSSGLPYGAQQAGSGFIVDKTGLILTAGHLVSNPEALITVTLSDGREATAEVVHEDPVTDTVLLKISADSERFKDLPFLELSDSELPGIGQPVIAVYASDVGFASVFSTGTVLAVTQDIAAGNPFSEKPLQNLIKADTAVAPGGSGGPLLDMQGQVIGMILATSPSEEEASFALPAEDLKPLLR
jgi:S1-C subfamily serine protease